MEPPSDPPRLTRLTRKHRRLLVLAAAVLAGLFGPIGFLVMSFAKSKYGALSSFHPKNLDQTLAGIAGSGPALLFLLLAALATLGVAFKLIGYLERHSALPARPFYVRAAVAGVMVGVIATVLTTMGLLMIAIALGQTPIGSDMGPVALFLSGLFIGVVGGFGSVLLLSPFIVIAGPLLGLSLGWVTRKRTLCPGAGRNLDRAV